MNTPTDLLDLEADPAQIGVLPPPPRRHRRWGLAVPGLVIAALLFVIVAPGWANGLTDLGATVDIDDSTSLPLPVLWYDTGWADDAGGRGRSMTIHGGARGDRWISFAVLPGLSADPSRYEAAGRVTEDELGPYPALRIELPDGTIQFAVPDLSILVLVRDAADEATMRTMFDRIAHDDEIRRSA